MLIKTAASGLLRELIIDAMETGSQKVIELLYYKIPMEMVRLIVHTSLFRKNFLLLRSESPSLTTRL